MIGLSSLVLLTSLAATSNPTPAPQTSDELAWSQFRGTDGTAVGDEAPLPTRFGPTEGVLWKTALPPGHSSPCVVGDGIYLTGFEDGESVLLCVDRTTGEVAWRRTFEGEEHPQYFHPDAVPAVPTVASDGEHVVAYFGNYGLVATDTAGELLWERRLPLPPNGFGVGNSPLLFEGLLILVRDGAEEAAILALDVTDGSDLWRVDRFEFGESHGSPFLWRNADRDELVVGGSNRLSSYHPGTGELLWQVDGLTSFPCTTPTGDRDTLYYAAWSTGNATGRSFWEAAFTRSLELSDEEVANPALLFARLDANADGKVTPDEVPECRAKDAFGFIDADRNGSWEVEEMNASQGGGPPPGRNLMVAVARGASGDATAEHLRWTHTRGLPYVSSPLLYRNRIWLVKSGGFVSCLEAETGAVVFGRERLTDRSEYYMSPVGAGGKVLIGSAEGTLAVLDAEADTLEVELEIAFGDELFATPAVVDGTIYLRSKSTLWAFGTDE